MLVLTRKCFEAIYVGRGVRVTVVDLRDGSVRIGIDAPDDVTILREEIADPGLVAEWDERDMDRARARKGRAR